MSNSTLSSALLLSLLVLPLAGCPSGGNGDDDTANDDDATVDPCAGIEPVSGTSVAFEQIGSGLDRPVDITTAGDGSGRIFVVEQNGRIRVFRPGDDSANTWFDINSVVHNVGGLGDEQGLLALTFHPDYATNGRFYVHYDDNSGNTVVSEFTVEDPAEGEPDLGSERVILQITQPAGNHNGGSIHFGPDGYLYLGFGDGGGAGDTYDNGQNPDTLLAKILRIDVDNPSGGREYGIPADNPFVGEAVRDEVWAWGVRNPWRWSFDRETGDMWIADVGQNQREEIDLGVRGANYGWPCREAGSAYDGCPGDFTDPIFEYGHADGISITGGYVYRGCRMPDLRGQYFFSDFAYQPNSPLWSITADGEVGDVWEASVGLLIATFGEDEQGELLTADYSGGTLHRLMPD
jgi:glucose/arabinose dehydrogenase